MEYMTTEENNLKGRIEYLESLQKELVEALEESNEVLGQEAARGSIYAQNAKRKNIAAIKLAQVLS